VTRLHEDGGRQPKYEECVGVGIISYVCVSMRNLLVLRYELYLFERCE